MANQLQQRVERVLSCLGRSAGLCGSLPEEVQTKLAAFLGADGLLIPGSRDEAERTLNEHWDNQKATVDADTELDEVNFG